MGKFCAYLGVGPSTARNRHVGDDFGDLAVAESGGTHVGDVGVTDCTLMVQDLRRERQRGCGACARNSAPSAEMKFIDGSKSDHVDEGGLFPQKPTLLGHKGRFSSAGHSELADDGRDVCLHGAF